MLVHNSHQSIHDSLQEVHEKLPKGKFSLVGHSLGGLLAILVAAEHVDRYEKVSVISSPLAGSKVAASLRWLPGQPKIIRDITPTSPKIELISQLKLQLPTLSIISTAGNLSLPVAREHNDGVVTIESQRALSFGKKIEVKANHFEILMHDKTMKLLNDFLFEDSPMIKSTYSHTFKKDIDR